MGQTDEAPWVCRAIKRFNRQIPAAIADAPPIITDSIAAILSRRCLSGAGPFRQFLIWTAEKKLC